MVLVLAGLLMLAAACSNNESASTATTTPGKPTSTPVQQVASYSLLELTEVRVVDNGQILISGTTDLPDGASLTVGFNVVGRSGADLYIGVDKKTAVSNGQFSVTLPIPQREEFANGPYEVSVLFTPRGQSEEVLRFVGQDGEKLTGNLVDDTFGFQTMELLVTRDIDLSVEAPSYTFQLPAEFPEGSAPRALAEFVLAWKNQDWNAMVDSSQETWISEEPDPAALLEAWYDFKTLRGFEVKDVQTVSDVTADITFIVQYEAVTNEISKKQITARLIRENGPYNPSPQGEWGVNPLSTLAETDAN
jgi:hypothetical protein